MSEGEGGGDGGTGSATNPTRAAEGGERQSRREPQRTDRGAVA